MPVTLNRDQCRSLLRLLETGYVGEGEPALDPPPQAVGLASIGDPGEAVEPIFYSRLDDCGAPVETGDVFAEGYPAGVKTLVVVPEGGEVVQIARAGPVWLRREPEPPPSAG